MSPAAAQLEMDSIFTSQAVFEVSRNTRKSQLTLGSNKKSDKEDRKQKRRGVDLSNTTNVSCIVLASHQFWYQNVREKILKMATSYDSWTKYDVEKELERVDAQAQRDEHQLEAQKQRRAKQSVENDISKSAEQSAEVLAAHAAVAALKAKARARKLDSKTERDATATSSGSTQSDPVAHAHEEGDKQEMVTNAMRLQLQSELFKRKHELIKQIMEHRRLGEAILHGKEKKSKEDCRKQALEAFENALEFANELEKIVPDLLRAETEQEVLKDATHDQHSSSSTPQESVAKECGHDCAGREHHHHDHNGGEDDSSCCHHSLSAESRQPKSSALKKALPKVNDLEAIVKMFFKDIYVGIGTCHVMGNRLAAASEAFKEVLVRDDRDLQAWIERGKAFEQMGANLLAMLHFGRVTSLDAQDERAKEALARVKDSLLTGENDIMSDKAIEREIEARTESKPLDVVLDSIRLLFQEANVLMIEGFFQYAIPKYQIVLGCIDFVDQNAVLYAGCKELAAAIHDSVNQIKRSCLLNIAGGYQEMQKGQAKALEHCEQILGSDSKRNSSTTSSVCHFRMGQLYRSIHAYENAMTHLIASRNSMRSDAALGSQSEQQSVLQKIDKEIDRCEFDRSQYDLAYIRSRLASEFKSFAAA